MYSLSRSDSAEALLHRHELGAGIALVGEEEQPGVELTDPGIEPVGEVVAPAQDVDAEGVLVGQGDVGVGLDEGLPGGVGGRQVDRVELVGRRRAALRSTGPDRWSVSCSASDDRSQISMRFRIRRATR